MGVTGGELLDSGEGAGPRLGRESAVARQVRGEPAMRGDTGVGAAAGDWARDCLAGSALARTASVHGTSLLGRT